MASKPVEVHRIYLLRTKAQQVLGLLDAAFSRAAQTGEWDIVRANLEEAAKEASELSEHMAYFRLPEH